MNPYEDAPKLRELFGRFEYALKRANHQKKGSDVAQADWASFAKAVGNDLFEEVAKSGIADTLINDPPRKLMADLNWRPENPTPLKNIAELLVQGVCRVRNSYVHGEKFVSHGDQWERDVTLVHEALAVLLLIEGKSIIELPAKPSRE